MQGSTPLSPELVLVSPDLREIAFDSLPDPGSFAPAAAGPEAPAASILSVASGLRLAPADVAPEAAPPAARPSPFSMVEVTVRVPVVLAVSAYIAIETTRRVVEGVGIAILVVAALSLLLG